MAWFLAAGLAAVPLLVLLAVIIRDAFFGDDGDAERFRIEMEIRRAERRIHEVARDSFQAMLNEARGDDARSVK